MELNENFKTKTVVIKYGGNAMTNDSLKEKVISDIIKLKNLGIKVVIVHGGGPDITQMLKRVGKESSFIGGLRVTDEETMEIAEMVLVGKTNTQLVSMFNLHGINAIGLNGKDANLIRAKKTLAKVAQNGVIKEVDVGYVGDVAKINTKFIKTLLKENYVPVIAPIGMGRHGETYNINADFVAGEVASALKADILLLLTDVEGIYSNWPDKDSFMKHLSLSRAEELIMTNNIDGGMIPKIEACLKALKGGVARTQIIDGRKEHAILEALFREEKIGTTVTI